MGRKIKEVMTASVEVVEPDTSIRDAAEMMKGLNVGILPVCDGDRLVGTITDRDIVVRAVTQEADLREKTVKDFMTSPVIYCFEEQDIEDVARIMEAKRVRRLVVLNSDKKLTGIVSLGDFVWKVGREDLAGEILHKVTGDAGEESRIH